jgi:hypothetical protein
MTITGSYRDEDEAAVSSIIMALLDLLHRDCSGDQGGPNWAAWANGNSPYELALHAVCEKFGIAYDIEWKANCNNSPEGRIALSGCGQGTPIKQQTGAR